MNDARQSQEPVKPRGIASFLKLDSFAGSLFISFLLSVAAMLIFRSTFFLFLVLPIAPLGHLYRRMKESFRRRS